MWTPPGEYDGLNEPCSTAMRAVAAVSAATCLIFPGMQHAPGRTHQWRSAALGSTLRHIQPVCGVDAATFKLDFVVMRFCRIAGVVVVVVVVDSSVRRRRDMKVGFMTPRGTAAAADHTCTTISTTGTTASGGTIPGGAKG